MKKRFLYLRYYLKHLHHKFRAKRGGMYSIMHTKFLGKMPPSDEEANHLIKEMITSGKPFALCRLGSAEFTLMQLFDEYQLFPPRQTPSEQHVHAVPQGHGRDRAVGQSHQRGLQGRRYHGIL